MALYDVQLFGFETWASCESYSGTDYGRRNLADIYRLIINIAVALDISVLTFFKSCIRKLVHGIFK